MKKSYAQSMFVCAIVVLTALFSACSTELASPQPYPLDQEQIKYRTDFTGLEDQVKVKVAERDQISINSITSCYYYTTTSEGYGRYHFTTNTGFGIYTVTGIIGDEIEGW